jgi:anti-sigma B factor antagonist
MPVIASESSVGPVTLLELTGRLTSDTMVEVHEKLQNLAASGRTAMLLDCSQVTAIDSRGLGSLVRDWVSIERRGGQLKLLRLSERMREAIQLTGLHKLFQCFEDVGVALRSF